MGHWMQDLSKPFQIAGAGMTQCTIFKFWQDRGEGDYQLCTPSCISILKAGHRDPNQHTCVQLSAPVEFGAEMQELSEAAENASACTARVDAALVLERQMCCDVQSQLDEMREHADRAEGLQQQLAEALQV